MRIGLVRREFGGIGGAELYAQRILNAFIECGHSVTLVTAGEVVGIPKKVGLRKIDLPTDRTDKVISFDKSARQVLANEPLDCVFSLERMTAQDVCRAGDGVHSVWLDKRKMFAPWWRRPFVGWGKFHKTMMWLERQTFNPSNTRRIIVNSEMVKDEILATSQFPDSRIHVIRNGIENRKWKSGRRIQTREKWGAKEKDFVLLFAGSGWERKGLKYVLNAVEHLNGDFKLVVAGKGSPPFTCPGNVTFLGPLTDMEDVYAAADLLVFTPIYEPSANVVFEALAAGLPVVTTRQNGASEIIERGLNGSVLQDPTDRSALIGAIYDWGGRKSGYRVRTRYDLSIERNLAETIEVLELACSEKKLDC